MSRTLGDDSGTFPQGFAVGVGIAGWCKVEQVASQRRDDARVGLADSSKRAIDGGVVWLSSCLTSPIVSVDTSTRRTDRTDRRGFCRLCQLLGIALSEISAFNLTR